ncbi:MAG: hypothetical protein HYY06_05900 [Deltaproteobacteria bacterium]|nr:hypothetical protein [Deltaproteobacteria bacterium]
MDCTIPRVRMLVAVAVTLAGCGGEQGVADAAAGMDAAMGGDGADGAAAPDAAADAAQDPCADGCEGRRCGSVGTCGGTCGSAEPIAFEASIPTQSLASMEATLHAKQEKIAVTSDGTIHLYLQLDTQGAAYARSHDGGATWEAFQLLDERGWLGVIAADEGDDLHIIYASSWREGNEYRSSPQAVTARVDRSADRWTWTWGQPTALLPHPPNPRHGFLDFALDSQGTFHLVTASTEAFSFDAPDEPVRTGIHYFRSASPFDPSAFDPGEELFSLEIWPVEVPGFALGYGGDPAVDVDGTGGVVLVYSDRSLYQSGLEQAQWPDTGARGTLFVQRALPEAGSFSLTTARPVARGVYGDADILVDPDGTTHVVYTIVESGSSYRAAYRQIGPDDEMGPEVLLTERDPGQTERTIFPSLARLADGSLVVALTDRLADPAGSLAATVRPAGAPSFGCVVPLSNGPVGDVDANLLASADGGMLRFVYLALADAAGEHRVQFGSLDADRLKAASAR